MEAVTILAVGFVCVASFLAGVRVGRAKDDPIVPVPLPVIPKKEVKNREAEMERHRMEMILSNIEKYDGTSRGQEDVPGGR